MVDLIGWAYSNNYKIAWGDIRFLNDSFAEFQTMSRLGQLNDLQSDKLAEWSSGNHKAETWMKTKRLIRFHSQISGLQNAKYSIEVRFKIPVNRSKFRFPPTNITGI